MSVLPHDLPVAAVAPPSLPHLAAICNVHRQSRALRLPSPKEITKDRDG